MVHATVLILAALAAAPSAPAKRADPTKAAEAWATAICRNYATDPENPWALAHGVGAFGPELRTSDGRLAVDVMVADFVEKRGEGADLRYGFSPNRGRIPIDPHPNHTVMTLLRSGLPLMRVFKTRHGDVTLGQLADAIRREFVFEPSDTFWRNNPWTLDALAAVTRERDPRWTNRRSQQVDLRQVLDAAVDYVIEQHRFLDEARRDGVAMMPKRRQFIWNHPCGGLHLVQGAFAWATEPGFLKRHKARAEQLVDVLFYRMVIESRTYEDALTKSPEYALELNVQRLKFFGHWLETMARLKELKLWSPTPQRRELMAEARAQLAQAALALQAERADQRMAEFKTTRPQVYLDLIGDGCHASSALRESR